MTTSTTRVPHYDLKAEYDSLREEILASLDRVCRRSAFILGEEVEAFEHEFAAYCGARHCVALNSGTSALHLGLLALGAGPGDDVVTTPNTFLATAEAITYCGARPVFADIDPGTANLDPQKVARAITPRTKVILPVHLYGRPAAMDAFAKIAAQRRLKILEDACQAHGARSGGERVGTLGDAGAFSFYPSKNLGAYGEGGALVTNDDSIAAFARLARSHGQAGRYDHRFVGFNYRMDGVQAAVLRVKLRHLDSWNACRRHIASRYRQLLAGAPLEIPRDSPDDECVYHLFSIFVNERDAVQKMLLERGVETSVHYPRPVHFQPAYSSLGYGPGSFPQAERACERVLSLPCFPGLTAEQVDYVAMVLRDIASGS